jgi:hypothetical protein
MHEHQHTVTEVPLPLQATTADPFIADIDGVSADAQARLDAYRARIAASPCRRIYD